MKSKPTSKTEARGGRGAPVSLLGEWISLEDDWPPDELEVLVFGRPNGWETPSIFIAILDCLDWKVEPLNDPRNAIEYIVDVTHWMKLPAPPNDRNERGD